MAESRIKDIFLHLQSCGYSVYFPADKVGQCTEPYIVINGAGILKLQGFSSTQYLYDLMLYVPKNQYSAIEELMEKLKQDMKKMEPMIKPTYTETAPYYDESVRAYMVSVQYKNYRQII